MYHINAEIEIVETGERVHVLARSTEEVFEKAKTQIGEFVHFVIRSIAIMTVLLYTTTDIPLEIAPSTTAPQCVEYCNG